MAKRKKKAAQFIARGFGTKNLDAEIRRVSSYLAKENYNAAIQVLLPLSEQYPQSKDVWLYLLDASYGIQQMGLYQKAAEGLFAVEPSGETAYLLGTTYLTNMHPLLALQTLRQALELDPDHDYAKDAREAVTTLEPMLQEVLNQMGLTEADGIEMAILHERGQVYLAQGDYEATRKAEETVLEQHSNFLPARNNLSLISWMEGDVEQAVANAQTVLEQEPENIHALANLVHFLVVSGDAEAAKSYGDRLKASQADAWDSWTKKLEGLSYLADDASIIEVWEQARAAKVNKSPTGALFYHLAAVALARSGDQKQAVSQWKAALNRDPNFTLAKENLEDIRLPVGQRHGAWPFEWEQWFMPNAIQELAKALYTGLNSSQSGKIASEIKRFLKDHPYLMPALARVLERGGPEGQNFVLEMAGHSEGPELLELIKEFALGQNGSDQMRNHAASLAAKAKLLPKENVRLWIGGKWQELMLMGYEFHNEPLVNHPKAVAQLLRQALPLLKQNNAAAAVEAEALLNKALEKEPDAPDLLNNLGMAYQLQGREEESYALLRDLANRFPDYVFARTSLAKLHLLEGDLEAAEALLKPMMTRDRFHVLEFAAFSDAYLELLLAKKHKDSARQWLQMWEQVCDQSDYVEPRLKRWQLRLNPLGSFRSKDMLQ